ncbi:N-acetylneuraminate synthase [Halorussus litoreus]|uniref:N-acetylneuraminate synthase n=1 Tax=Halorussus litoreus TaxID=1710536 RepID=UPI000E269342|nr:N-acetylneuraminate synthase [Halorussus litoreus]
MRIDERRTGDGSVFFIAEAGVNHNGTLSRARELIDVAAETGADAIKFQTFTADRLVTKEAPKANYQTERSGSEEVQRDMLERYELSESDHEELLDYCESRRITFLSTPFDVESANLLDELDVPAIKIGSGDLTNHPLLRHVARFERPMIVSTGMATIAEVEDAYAAIREASDEVPVTLLHCVSSYPAEMDAVNLRAMATLDDRFPVPVGYSDHTTALETPGFAVAAGATVVEKHFTLDRTLPGPDHEASLEPGELVRTVEIARSAATARGSREKAPVAAEMENRTVARKSLHAATALERGETIRRDAVSVLRPADGLPPSELESVVGRRTTAALEPHDPITGADVEGDNWSEGQT